MRAIDADILEKKLKDAINMCMSIDTSGLSELKAVLEDVEEMPTIEPRCETCEAFNKTRLLIPQPQRTGRWIFDKNDYLTKCSECGCHPWFGVIPTVKEATKKLPHCPMCLAKMEGE